MAYWWSNCIQLRWMLWAMCHGGGFGDAADGPPIVNEFDWVMKVRFLYRQCCASIISTMTL